MLNSKAKAQAFVALRVIVALFAWCAMMLLYFKAHDLIEQDSVPLMLQSKVFSTQSWDKGISMPQAHLKISRRSILGTSFYRKGTT